MGSDVFEFVVEGSSDIFGAGSDPLMHFSKGLIVPHNSSIQSVMPKIVQAINRAKLLRPPYRSIAIAKAKEALYGIASIGSEGGNYLKELNTTRQSLSYSPTVKGQPASPLDKWLHGKRLENNPQTSDDGLRF